MENTATISKLSPVKLWTPRTIGWLTLIFGFSSGFILATINWWRMGHTRKALLHLLVGIVLAGLDIFLLRNYIGYSRWDTIGLSSTQFTIRILINLVIIFAFVAYFHTVIAKDIQRFEGFGNVVEKGGIFQAIIIAIIVAFCFKFVYSFVPEYRLVSMQNYVYCELLQPGMTSTQVSEALMEIGSHQQIIYEGKLPEQEAQKFDAFLVVFFEEFNVELKNDLWIGLGYDENNKLVWISRRYTGGDHFRTIECPWTIRSRRLYN